jgi:ribose transport system permease protein
MSSVVSQVRPSRAGHIAVIIGERYGILVAWIAIIVGFGVAAPQTFLTAANFQTIFGSQSVLLLLSLGLLITLNAGEFDLSPGAALGFASTLFGYLNAVAGVQVVVAVLIVLAVGLAYGLLNAILVVVINIPGTVATLGSGTLLTGVGLAISSQLISGVDVGFVSAIRAHVVLGLPVAFFIALAACAIIHYVFQHTPFGRQLVFVGRSREVARLAGVRVNRTRMIAFVSSAFIAFAAGILLVGFNGAADPTSGPNLLLPAFACAFLGETAIRPGQFNVPGSFVAVYFLVTGVTGLELVGLSGWIDDVFYGAALLVAVAIAQIVTARKGKQGPLGRLLRRSQS